MHGESTHWCESNFGSSTACLPNSICILCLSLCSARHDYQGSNTNVWGGGGLHLPMARCDDGQDGGFGRRFDLFVLLSAGSGSPLHALMSWCGVWCWPSNLLWCSGPGVHPSILPLFSHTSHTQSTSHAGTHSLIYIAGRKHAAAPSCSWWWNGGRMCTCACFFMFVWKSERWRHDLWLVYVCRQDGTETLKTADEMLPTSDKNCWYIFSSWLFLFSHSFTMYPLRHFFCFVQAASAAFQKHNCFPLLLFPGMLISCDDQRDAGIKVLRFKHFVVFIVLP